MLRRLILVSGLLLATTLPGRAQDAADLVVRLNRLENQSRQMAGQIETLQYENRQLKEQLRKFQEDVEYRFQEGKGARPSPPAAASKPAKRSDAFDPSQSPGAPGAPQPLGATTPSTARAVAAAPATPNTTATLAPPTAALEETVPPYGEPVDITPPSRAPSGPVRPRESVAATGTGDAKADYEMAYAYVLQRQYEQAEMSLRQFIQSHPRDALVPDATYWLGETYLQRNRTREAAEQFLKVSTDYARSRKAPEAMLKLGASLNALGAREQACATLAELERKFPQASAAVKQGVDREQKRARCAA
ncbi:tol-pal system protein YbgF [Methylobacterium nodulans]|uniref:Cell division coordinator CpoB n=1 Tax=Methylobacterium nodulans (strain LMG 21967 / CNCM I-2342 / ORS 2060) TaxID=460265 RepID=B8IP15_METNO|nr:tol-pal system protein YbgF [Methylobacterium nodulans]ACL60333.1 tol-pal system protein YbgF [Methylobacterium nodulans ORS 2060]